MNKLIYVVDDERDVRETIYDFLAGAGYAVELFAAGEEMLAAFEKKPCDLLVLDILLPGEDGLALCRRLRETSDVPIILLSCLDSEASQMRGFLLGCDDYVPKPFSPALLTAKVGAMLRRADALTPAEEIRFADIVFAPAGHRAACGQTDLGLSMTEYSLLGCLLERPGTAVSRNVLLDRVWGIDAGDIETRVTDETVRRIRQKLKKAGSRAKIVAVWGYGYKLVDGNEENKN